MDQEQVKQAEMQKEAADRIAAFEFGMDLFFQDNGIDKVAMAELASIPQDTITERGIECLAKAMEQTHQ